MRFPPGRLPGRDHAPLAALLVATLALGGLGITWGLPNTMDWAIDSVAPYRVLQAAYQRFSGGWWDKYPPFHYLLLTLGYVPYLGYLKLTGGLGRPSRTFPFGLEDPSASLGTLILLSRLVSLLMAAGVVGLVFLTAKRLFDRLSALFAALVIGLSAPFVYYAHTANLDIPVLFWIGLAMYAYTRVIDRGSLGDYLRLALFATLAVCTKDQAAGLFALAPLAVLWARGRELRDGTAPGGLARLVLDRRNVLALVLAVAVFATVQNLPFNAAGFLRHVRFITGPGSENYHEFPATPAGRVQLLGRTLSYLAQGLTPPLFAASTVGSCYAALRFPRRTLPVLLLGASYWLVFLNVMRMVLPRFVLPIVLVMAPFGGKLLADLWRAARWRRAARAGIVAAFAFAVLFPIQLDLLFLRDPRYAAERWLREQAPRGALVDILAPLSLLNYYPRFPAWVEVRGSRVEAGAAWEAPALRRDRLQIPNATDRSGPPDYIVLSEFWYDRFFAPDAGPPEAAGAAALRDLFAGRLGYRQVAAFETPAALPLGDLRVNPRILIFAPAREPSRAGGRGAAAQRASGEHAGRRGATGPERAIAAAASAVRTD